MPLDFFKNLVYPFDSNHSVMNKKPHVIGIELEELMALIQKTVRTEIEACLKDCRFGLEYKDEVWDRKTVASFLKISSDKVTYLYKQKKLPGHKLGREYVFLKSDILNLFNYKA
jgi:hypothetical protein